MIYGGTAQLTAMRLLDSGATTLVAIAAVFAVNARLLVLSATAAPQWRAAPLWWRTVSAFVLIDPSLFVAVEFNERETSASRQLHFYMGAAWTLWLGWLSVTAVGVFVGPSLSEIVPVDVLMPLVLVALLARMLKTGHAAAAAIVTGASPFRPSRCRSVSAWSWPPALPSSPRPRAADTSGETDHHAKLMVTRN